MGKLRKAVQVAWGLLSNAHLSGFVTGQIYRGKLKNFCVPGMNCYSCPGALGACPLGAAQNFLAARRPRFPFYVLGFLMTAGVLVGRFICGWLCLFGLVQELLYMIPTPKIKIPPKVDRILRKLKYVFLVVFVILLPLILRDEMGLSVPAFCKWICPVGMLEGGVPLLILNKALRGAAHYLYAWKLGILVVCILASILIHRPFCRYICPLGAFYGLLQRVSLLRLEYERERCIHCGKCAAVCGMGVDPTEDANGTECIRCGECIKTCPTGALAFRFGLQQKKKPEKV